MLQALRAHDDRFNATINQLELNKKRPDNIQVIGVGGGPGDNEGVTTDGDSKLRVREIQSVFSFPNLDEWKDAIYAKMVKRVGTREYWETWAGDVAAIADRHVTRIKALIDDPNAKHAKPFGKFLVGLQTNLNHAVTREDAIDMLAQHLITGPVFNALFGNHHFTQHNPVAQAMQRMLKLLDEQAIGKEVETLMALSTRFCTTCVSWKRSPTTRTASCGKRNSIFTLRSRVTAEVVSITSRATAAKSARSDGGTCSSSSMRESESKSSISRRIRSA